MKRKTFITMLSVIFVAAIAFTVQAQTVDECTARIDLIQADLDAIYGAGGIGGNNPERTYTSLTSKLQGAIVKLGQQKYGDAGRKLDDFKTAVTAMRDAAKPKLSPTDAGLLLDGGNTSSIDEGINGAILCVALLP